MRRHKNPLITSRLLAVVSALFALSCAKNTTVGNEPAGLSASIFEIGGQKPAAEALVKVFTHHSTDDRPVLICVTDAQGRFSIKGVASGLYDIYAEKDSFVLFQDSIVVASDRGGLRNDTLESPSSLIGIVGLESVHDPNTVIIHVTGMGKTVDVSDDDGHFSLKGIPGGKCVLMLESRIPGYLPTFKEIVVATGTKDTITDTLRLSYSGVPFVSGIRLSQDIFSGTIRVSWNKTQCADFKDYVVYHDPCTSIALLPEPSHSSADTFLIDSMFSLLYATPFDTLPQCLKYRVAVRTLSQQVGLTTGYTEFQFLPKMFVWTFFTTQALCEGRRFDSVSIDDTIVFSFTAKNRTRPLRKLVWHDPQKGRFPAYVPDTTKKEMKDSIRYAFHETGYHQLRAIVTDSAGTEWFDFIVVHTVIDTLNALAGNDTGVFAGEKVKLHGAAYHLFGTIPFWRWKIGANDWSRTSGSDTVFRAPLTEDKIECDLRITDEDGTSKNDTVNIFTSLKVKKIASGDYHGLLLKTDGALWSFGRNEFGQLCDGNKESRYLPVRVMTDVKDMAAGAFHTLVLKNDMTLWACGNNSKGQFGDGTTEGRLLPKRIMSDVQSIAAGGFFSVILKTDGKVLVCGDFYSGRFSDTTIADLRTPVPLMSDVQSIAAGFDFILALKKDGTLWTCGSNFYGQLCDSSNGSRFVPQQVLNGVKSMAAGRRHSLIVKNDGTLWACGSNSYGQLGDFFSSAPKIPQKVMTGVSGVAAGAYHSLIIKTDGALWVCGNNSAGQLGDGTFQNHGAPSEMVNDVLGTAAGYDHSMILKTDSTVWACGSNDYGQLGNSTSGRRARIARTVPYHYY